MNNYNVIYLIKYSCIDAIIIFHNPGAISSSLSQIDKYMMGTVSLKFQMPDATEVLHPTHQITLAFNSCQ